MSKQIPVIDDDTFMVGNTTDFSKSIGLMFNSENIGKKTDLDAKAIAKLTQLYTMAIHYEIPLLKDMCNKFVELRVSLKRKGRDEAVKMTQQISTMKRLEALEDNMGRRK